MTDNFELLYPHLHFTTDDYFYFLQIIKRKKEHPDMPKSVKVVHTFYIDSEQKLRDLEQEIKDLCTYHNARAYINLNRRSFRMSAYQMLKQITDCIISGEYKYIRKSFNTVCGRFSAESKDSKTWVVDVDVKDLNVLGKIHLLIGNCDPVGEKLIVTVPTKHGYHLITRPFNTNQFETERWNFKNPFVLPEIHKDNPTVLYIS